MTVFEDSALAYAHDGLPVFPLKPRGKIPLTEHGLDDATTDTLTIETWWSRYPNANVAIRTGELVVVDEDQDGAFQRLCAEHHQPVPDTRRARTGSGRHWYFTQPEGTTIRNTAGKLAPGIDTRGAGGYVVAPPSIHPSGTAYTWEAESDPVELPHWIALLLEKREPQRQPAPPIAATPRTSAYAQRALEQEAFAVANAPDGTRNHTLNVAAFNLGQLVAGGELDEWDARNALAAAARACGLGDKEADATLESGLSSGLATPRTAPQRMIATPHLVAATNGAPPAAAGEAFHVESPPTAGPVFETLRAFQERELPPAESLVGKVRGGTNLLPRYGWVMPWGREGCGKTSVLVDLAFHAAAGQNWQHYQIDRPIRLVLVINEGVPGGLQEKLKEKLEFWEGDTNTLLDAIAIYASPWGEFTFRNAQMGEHLRAYAVDFQADYVVLDPLHTMGSSGAGSPQETEEFKHILRAHGLWQDLGFVTAHHSNKNGMVSGDWGRHPDTVIHLEKDGKRPATKLTLEKARPADPHELGVPQLLEWQIETMGYKLTSVDAAAIGDLNRSHVLQAVLDGATNPDAIAATTGLSVRTARRHLQALAEEGRIGLATGAGKVMIVTPPIPVSDEPEWR